MSKSTAVPAPAALTALLQNAGLPDSSRPLFLTFFRSDCTWCTSEMPRLAIAFQRHKDLEVNVLAIAVGTDDAAVAVRCAAEYDWSYPVLTDPDSQIRRDFGVERVPTVLLINRAGEVERTYEGVTEQLVGIIEQTIYAAAHATEPPEYDMVGNGCAP